MTILRKGTYFHNSTWYNNVFHYTVVHSSNNKENDKTQTPNTWHQAWDSSQFPNNTFNHFFWLNFSRSRSQFKCPALHSIYLSLIDKWYHILITLFVRLCSFARYRYLQIEAQFHNLKELHHQRPDFEVHCALQKQR